MEREYREGASERYLSEKYGVTRYAVRKAITEGGWRYEDDLKKRLDRLTEIITRKMEEAVSQLEFDSVKGESLNTGVINTQKMRHIIQSMKDLKDIIENGEKADDNSESRRELISVIEEAMKDEI